MWLTATKLDDLTLCHIKVLSHQFKCSLMKILKSNSSMKSYYEVEMAFVIHKISSLMIGSQFNNFEKPPRP